MANPRPNPAFAFSYPFPQDVLGRLAYYYEYDYADGRDPLDYFAPVLRRSSDGRSSPARSRSAITTAPTAC